MKMKKILLLISLATCMAMPVTVQAATSNVTVTIVDGKNTKNTKDDTKYTVSVKKGKKMSEGDIGKVKVWAKENTQGRSSVTKEGYSVSVPSIIKNKFSKNTTLKLVYKQTKPIVEFYDSIGKKVYAVKVGELGKTIELKTPPVHEGYVHTSFTGVTEKTVLNKVKKYTAKAIYKENKYKIQFDGNGASNPSAMKSVEVKYSQKYSLPKAKFKKSGYTFSAWEINGTKYKTGSKISKLVSKDGGFITAKAIWEAGTYTIKFNSNGGKGTMNSIKMKTGQEYKLPACKFTKERYLFEYWKDDNGKIFYDEDDFFENNTGKKTVTLKAQWKIDFNKTGKLTGYANGGKFADGTTQKIVYAPIGEYVNISHPFRDGYIFGGWMLKGDVIIDPLETSEFHLPRDASFVLTRPEKGEFGNGTATAKWIKRPTSEQFVKAVYNVANTARTKEYGYGNTTSEIPTNDKWIACDSLIAKALYDLGFTQQPKMGGFKLLPNESFEDFLLYCGFEKTKTSKRGSILIGEYDRYNGGKFTYVLAEPFDENTKEMVCYDCNSPLGISSNQPVRKILRWKNYVFYSLPQ